MAGLPVTAPGEGRPAVVLQRAKQRIGVDLVTGAFEVATGVIVTQIVAQ